MDGRDFMEEPYTYDRYNVAFNYPLAGIFELYSWMEFGYDSESVTLIAGDIVLGGPTGEGIGPALALLAAKQASNQTAKQAGHTARSSLKK